MLTQPPLLSITVIYFITLQSCQFNNFLYEFNSFIELNSYGGFVSITSSQFNNISSCGSLIRNKNTSFVRTDVTGNSFFNQYTLRTSNLQNLIYSQTKYQTFNTPFAANCSTTNAALQPCWGITIITSTFTNFLITKTYISTPVWVSSTSSLRITGMILDLDSFFGHVNVNGNTFTNNQIPYASCGVATLMKNIDYTGFTDSYPLFGSKTVLQIQSLISVVNHWHNITMSSNTFNNNTGTKGIIYLDLFPRTYGVSLLGDNKFNRNAGYLNSNVLFIRMRGNQGYPVNTTVPTDSQLFCTGLHLQANTFNQSTGCLFTSGGTINAECVDYDAKPITNNDGYNSSFSILNMASAYTSMSFQYTNLNFTTIQSTKTYSSNMKINYFYLNKYIEQPSTNGLATIDLKGLQRVWMQSENFLNNGDMLADTFQAGLSPLFWSDTTYSLSYFLVARTPAFDTSQLSLGLIRLTRLAEVNVLSIGFNQNWLAETPVFNNNRSQLFKFEDFYGQVSMTNFTVIKHTGMKNTYVTSNLGVSSSLFKIKWYTYASAISLIKFKSTDQYKFITSFPPAWSTFSAIGYQQIPENIGQTIFPVIQNTSIGSIGLYNSTFINFQCFWCNITLFTAVNQSVNIQNCTFTSINDQGYIYTTSYMSILNITLRKPFYNALYGSITLDTLYILNTSADTSYNGGWGRFTNVNYLSLPGEQEPTSAQIMIYNSSFSNQFTDYHGGIFYIDSSTMLLNVVNTSFSNITSGYNYNTTLAATLVNKFMNGSIFYIANLGQVYFNNITTQNINGYINNNIYNLEGRLIYTASPHFTNLTIINSSLSFNNSFTQTTSSNKYYGSIVYIQTSNTIVVSVSNSSHDSSQYGYYSGGLTILSSSSVNLNLFNNTFSNNYGQFGGAIYCQNCMMEMTLNSFISNYAIQFGGDICAMMPYENITLAGSSHYASNVGSLGAAIYVFDNSSDAADIYIEGYNGSMTNFSSISCTGSGQTGVIYLNTISSLLIEMDQTNFANIQLDKTAGVYIASAFTGDLTLTLTNSQISSVSSIQNGGFLFTYDNDTNYMGQAQITFQNTTFSQVSTSNGDGGVFSFGSFSSLNFNLMDSQISSCSASNQGGFIVSNANSSTITFENSSFDSLSATNEGGILYSEGKGPISLTLTETNVTNVKSTSSTGSLAALNASSISFVFSQSIIDTLTAYGSVISIIEVTDTVTMSILDSQISNINNQEGDGSFIYFQGSSSASIDIESTNISSINTQGSGGFIYGLTSGQLNLTISTSSLSNLDTKYDSNTLGGQGGFAYLSGSIVNVQITESSMNSFDTEDYGGIFYIDSSSQANISILDSNITQFKSELIDGGGFLYLTSSSTTANLKFTLQNNIMSCLSTGLWDNFPDIYNMAISRIQNQQANQSVALTIAPSFAGQITSSQNTFKNCYNCLDGCLIQVENKDLLFQDFGSTFTSMASVKGVINCIGCQLSFNQSTFSDIISYNGSALYLNGSYNVSFDQSTFYNLKAQSSGGLIYATEGASSQSVSKFINISNCQKVQYLDALNRGGLIMIDYDPYLNVDINNCSISSVSASNDGGGLIYSTGMENLTITSLLVSNISANKAFEGSLLYVQQSTSVTLINISASNTFSMSTATWNLNAKSYSMSNFISIYDTTQVTVSLSTFSDFQGSNNGGIFSLNNVNGFSCQDTSFKQIQALQGGVIYMNNSLDNECEVSFMNVSFDQSLAISGGSIYALGSFNISLSNISIQDSYSSTMGGFLHIDTESSSLESFITVSDILTVSNASSGQGGLFNLIGSNIDLTIQGNSTISNSIVTGKGGVIYADPIGSISITDLTLNNVQSTDHGSFLYQNSSSSGGITISNSTFNYLKQLTTPSSSSTGSVISVLDLSEGLILNNVSFSNIQQGFSGVFMLTNTQMTMIQSSIVNIYSYYGSIYCYNCSLDLQDFTFANLTTYSGGAIYADYNSNIYLTNVSVTNSSVTANGGVVYINNTKSTASSTSSLNILEYLNISNVQAGNQGGSFFINDSSINVVFDYQAMINIQNSTAGAEGGVFYIDQGVSFAFQNAQISTISSQSNGSFIYSQASGLQMSLTNNTVNCNSAASPTSLSGGAIYFANGNLTSSNNSISECSSSWNGGAVTVKLASFKDANSQYANLSSNANGGTIACDSCEITLEGIQIENSYAANNGGSIWTIKANSLNIASNISIINSSAGAYGGGLYINGTQVGSLTLNQDSSLQDISAGNGGLIYIDNPNFTFTLSNQTINTISTNSGQGGIIYLQQSKLITVENCNFSEVNSIDGLLLYSLAEDVEVQLENNLIKCREEEFNQKTIIKNIQNGQYDFGEVIYASMPNLINSSNQIYSNCFGSKSGGAFNIQGSTTTTATLIDQDSTYTNFSSASGSIYNLINNVVAIISNIEVENLVQQNGGLIYSDSGSNQSISNLSLQNSYSTGSGTIAYLTDSTSSVNQAFISISNSTFKSLTASANGGGFYVSNGGINSITLNSVQISDIYTQGQGGVFYIDNMNGELIIEENKNLIESKYYDFNASQGSFLYSEESNFSLSIEATNIMCYRQASSTNTQALNYNPSYIGSAFYIQNSENGVISNGNTYENCYPTSIGSIFNLESTSLTDTNSEFLNNQAMQGGAIHCSSCQLHLTSSSFSGNIGMDCGVISFQDGVTATITKSSFTNNNATLNGGVFCTLPPSAGSNIRAGTAYITFSQCSNINNNMAGQYGGFGILQNEFISLTISNSIISDSASTNRSGFLDISASSIISLSNVILRDISSSDTSMLYSTQQSLYFSMTSSTVVCNSTYTEDDAVAILSGDNAESWYSQTFYFKNAQNISFDQVKASYCGLSANGGFIRLLQSNFYDTGSTYTSCSAIYGGIIYSEQSLIYLNNLQVTNNLASYGGFAYLNSFSYLYATDLQISSNKAYQSGGVFFVQTYSSVNISSSTINNNYAVSNSVIESLSSSTTQNISFSSCVIESNSAEMNTMSFMYSSVVLNSVQFTKNLAQSRSKNVFLGFTNLYVYNSQFTGQSHSDMSETLVENDQTDGSFIYSILNSVIIIESSTFLYGAANQGGAIYISGDTLMNITQSQFLSNMAYQGGGAIYADGFQQIMITQTTFKNNLAFQLGEGGDIYFSNSLNDLILESCTLTNIISANSIYGFQAKISVNNTIASSYGTNSDLNFNGAFLYCLSCGSILINNSQFTNMIGLQGGIIYIEETNQNKLSTDLPTKYQILNSFFTNGTSFDGGAISLVNTHYAVISHSIFTNNQALTKLSYSQINSDGGSGGAIYLDCDISQTSCTVNISDNTTFNSNYALMEGGAIHWTTVEPNIDSTVVFIGNSAGMYGMNISCFAERIGKISYAEYAKDMSLTGNPVDRRMLEKRFLDEVETSSSLTGQQSGGDIPDFYLALIDKYGQVVVTDSSSKIRVIVTVDYPNQTQGAYSPVVQGISQFDIIGGVSQISGISFTGTPGGSYSLSFTTDGIDMSKPSNQEYQDSLAAQSDIEFQLKIQLRDCLTGESFTESGACVPCPSGSFYSLDIMTAPGQCNACPVDRATCLGGSNIGPKPGYWRTSNESDNFISCLTPSACLGMVPPQNNPQGSCLEGYSGILCAQCETGYSRSGDYECSKCPSNQANIFRLCAMMILVVIAIVLMVRSTLVTSSKATNFTSIYLKIFMNHVQLLLVTSSFDFKWPQSVKNFFSTTQPVSQVSQQILSVDCFITQNNITQSSDNDHNTIRMFFLKEVMYALLPLVVILISFGFWGLYYKIKNVARSEATMVGKSITTIIILLFLFHPNIVQIMFYNFKCMTIDTTQYLQFDLQVECWSPLHTFFSYFVALPSIFVWGLGIPFFALINLIKHRKTLNSIQTRQMFSFLFNGYKKKYYYWEIVIMYRKIALIFIFVFISEFGAESQALIVLVLLVLFVLITQKKEPFQTIVLNDLENLSLITSMASVYCGLFFLGNNSTDPSSSDGTTGQMVLSENTQLFFFFLIVLTNVAFFTYWTYKLFSEIRVQVLQKVPKLYLILYACLSQRRFEQDKLDQEIKLENDLLGEEYLKAIKKLTKLYTKGQLVLNAKSIQKIKEFIKPDNLIQIAGKTLEEDKLKKGVYRPQKKPKQGPVQSVIKVADLQDDQKNTIDVDLQDYGQFDKETNASKMYPDNSFETFSDHCPLYTSKSYGRLTSKIKKIGSFNNKMVRPSPLMMSDGTFRSGPNNLISIGAFDESPTLFHTPDRKRFGSMHSRLKHEDKINSSANTMTDKIDEIEEFKSFEDENESDHQSYETISTKLRFATIDRETSQIFGSGTYLAQSRNESMKGLQKQQSSMSSLGISPSKKFQKSEQQIEREMSQYRESEQRQHEQITIKKRNVNKRIADRKRNKKINMLFKQKKKSQFYTQNENLVNKSNRRKSLVLNPNLVKTNEDQLVIEMGANEEKLMTFEDQQSSSLSDLTESEPEMTETEQYVDEEVKQDHSQYNLNQRPSMDEEDDDGLEILTLSNKSKRY